MMNLFESQKARVEANLRASYGEMELIKALEGEELSKGKRATLGEVREWGGRKYQKTGQGWKEVPKDSSKKSGAQESGDSHLPKRYRNEFPAPWADKKMSKEEAFDTLTGIVFNSQGSTKMYHNAKLVMENSGLGVEEVMNLFKKDEQGFDSDEEFKEYQKELKDILVDADKLPSQKGRKEDQAYKDKKAEEKKSSQEAHKEKWKEHKFDPNKKGKVDGLEYSQPFKDGEMFLDIWGGSTISFKKGFRKEGSGGGSIISSVSVEGVNDGNYLSKMFELTNKLMDSEIGKEMGKDKIMEIAPKLIENFQKYRRES